MTRSRLIVFVMLAFYISLIEAADLVLPLTQKTAATLVAAQSSDKVISTSIDKDNSELFRVKTLSEQGHVRTYRVDSITGHILK